MKKADFITLKKKCCFDFFFSHFIKGKNWTKLLLILNLYNITKLSRKVKIVYKKTFISIHLDNHA